MAGKTNRKHGRSKRKPTDQRYKAEMRWEKNAKRRKARHEKRVARKRAKFQRLAEKFAEATRHLRATLANR